MQVIWRDGMTKGDNEPMTVVAVETASGSRISADLVVLSLTDSNGSEWTRVGEIEKFTPGPDAGLLEVIEAQMAAIEELSSKVAVLVLDTGQAKKLTDLQEWADQFPVLVENLCMALGFARNPVGPTGIPELDVIVSCAR